LCLPINLLVIPEFVLGPGIASSSDSLSWSQGTEFIDSYLTLVSFSTLSAWLSHDRLGIIEDVPLNILRQLTELDYRKALVVERMNFKLFGSRYCWVSGVPGIAKISSHIVFECIPAEKFDDLVPATFLAVRFKYG